MVVEPPFGLRLLLPFWCRRGGIGARLVRGKINRGKGGSGEGKIGAGVGSCRSIDSVGIQSGSSRDPVGHQCREAAKFIKNAFLQGTFFGDFSCFPTSPNVVPKTRKLVPDWIPTGARLRPDWIPTGFLQKTPIS